MNKFDQFVILFYEIWIVLFNFERFWECVFLEILDDKNWKKFTHLNPDANNIESGNIYLKYLLNGVPIKRNMYNHDTGKFIKEIIGTGSMKKTA